jgi:hypothetical protein
MTVLTECRREGGTGGPMMDSIVQIGWDNSGKKKERGRARE